MCLILKKVTSYPPTHDNIAVQKCQKQVVAIKLAKNSARKRRFTNRPKTEFAMICCAKSDLQFLTLLLVTFAGYLQQGR